jgi:hypothetical protein
MGTPTRALIPIVPDKIFSATQLTLLRAFRIDSSIEHEIWRRLSPSTSELPTTCDRGSIKSEIGLSVTECAGDLCEMTKGSECPAADSGNAA